MTLLAEPVLDNAYQQSLSLESFKLLPISNIFLNEEVYHVSLSKEKLFFCYTTVITALRAYWEGDYIAFDPLTTTNCCHGMSLLIHKLIIEMSRINVGEMMRSLEKNYRLLADNFSEELPLYSFQHYCIPDFVIHLAQLYLLSVIKEEDRERGGWRSIPRKLQTISPVSAKLCASLVKDLQTYFSNMVAENYRVYLEDINSEIFINNVPVKQWGKYVQPEHIRIDKRGRKYASCLFSMQVSVSYLIQHKVKIAVVNDLKCSQGIFRDRFIQLLVGNGEAGFNFIDHEDLVNHETNAREPVVIFGGCAHSNCFNLQSLAFCMHSWLKRFPSLILACDVFYPQYPNIRDDPDFNCNPIIPSEEQINLVIASHKQISGVSIQDPSLFCLSHIYTTSLQKISEVIHGKSNAKLPESFIPLSLTA